MYATFLVNVALLFVSIGAGATASPPKPIGSAKVFADPFPSLALRVGDSEDVLKILIDTGSNLLWINPSFFKKPSSTTHVTSQDWSINYVIGNCSGHVAVDEVHLGLMNQLDLKPSRRFGIADGHVSNDLEDHAGIIGLGRYDSKEMIYSGGWDMLAPTLTPRVIGLSMQHPLPGNSVTPDTIVGQIDYGAPDPAITQKGIRYTNIILSKAAEGWYINTHGTHVNGKPTGLGSRVALLDTGSTGIAMTVEDATKVNELLGGKVITSPGRDNRYVLPCNMGNATLEIDIEGTLFPVPNYLLLSGPSPDDDDDDDDDSMCGSWIQGVGSEGWTLGSGFLQAVYSVFDYDEKRVGFAPIPPLSQTGGSPGAASQGKGEYQAA